MMIRENDYKSHMGEVCLQGNIMMEKQKNVNPRMREILIDWMTEVCEEFMIKRDTLYISVNFIDRYISMADYEIPKNEL